MIIQLILLVTLLLPVQPAVVTALDIEPIPPAAIPFVWCYNMAYGKSNGQRVAIMAQRRMSCNNVDYTPRQPALWWRATSENVGVIVDVTGNDWNNAQLVLLYTVNSGNENNVHSLWFWPNENDGYSYYDELMDASIRGTENPKLEWRLINDNIYELFARIDYLGAKRDYKLIYPHWYWQAPYGIKLPMIVR